MATSTLPVSIPSSAAQKTYLQFCEEELNPDLLASCNQKSTLWKAAAIATLVAFTVFMVGAFIATALYAPVFIPIVGITSILLLGQIKKVYSRFDQWSDQAAERANQLSIMNRHYQELASSTPAQLQEMLRTMGINNVTGMQRNDPQLTTLKPLIARHLFWAQHVADLDKKKQEKLELATKLVGENFTENRDEIYELRSEALEFEKQVLESKAKNAFINAVIRRPHFVGTMEDLGTFSELSGQERAIAIQSNCPGAQEFFNFKTHAAATIQYNEAKQLAVPDLAMRIVAAMST